VNLPVGEKDGDLITVVGEADKSDELAARIVAEIEKKLPAISGKRRKREGGTGNCPAVSRHVCT
jgi:hypothetical protein